MKLLFTLTLILYIDEETDDFTIEGELQVNTTGEHCVKPVVNDDNLVENTESYIVRLSREHENDIVQGPSDVTVTIKDNDCKLRW